MGWGWGSPERRDVQLEKLKEFYTDQSLCWKSLAVEITSGFTGPGVCFTVSDATLAPAGSRWGGQVLRMV